MNKRDQQHQLSNVRYVDRIFPTQPFGNYLYADDASFEGHVHDLLSAFSANVGADLERPAHIDLEEMTSPPSQLAFFSMLIQLSGAKRILEIGTFIGKTSLQLAALVGPQGGHVTTIEAVESFADIAERNFKRSPHADRITLLRGDAGKVLEELTGSEFDFIFVDGSKQNYLPFTLASMKLISPRGVILIDDVFFHGDALNAIPTTPKGVGCKETLDYFAKFDQCSKTLIPAWNGVLLLYGFRQK